MAFEFTKMSKGVYFLERTIILPGWLYWSKKGIKKPSYASTKTIYCPAFNAFLKSEKPDIVHFHELAGSNGIGINHVLAAKKYGAKVILTFHLAGYTCGTGTLIYKENTHQH